MTDFWEKKVVCRVCGRIQFITVNDLVCRGSTKHHAHFICKACGCDNIVLVPTSVWNSIPRTSLMGMARAARVA